MNLRQQVGVATSVLSFLIVAAVAMGAAFVGERAVRASSEKKMSEIAFSVADRLNRGVDSRLKSLELLAQIETLKATWVGDPAAGRRILGQALRAIPQAAWLGFATRDGIVQAASGGLLEGHSIASEPWFQSRLAGGRITDVHSFEPLATLLPQTRAASHAVSSDWRRVSKTPMGECLASLQSCWTGSHGPATRSA
jgi:hypothetical protein